MATVLRGGVVMVNGYDLSCYLKSMTETAEVDMLDATTLCTTGARDYNPGLTSRTFSGEAFWSVGTIAANGAITPDETKNIQGLLKNSLGSQTGFHKITSGIEGAAVGARAVLYNADNASGDASNKIGDLLMVSFEATAGVKSGVPAYQDGNWLYYGSTAVAVTAASVDKAAAETGYFIRVHNASNMGGVTWQLEHSSNNSTWAAVASGSLAANTVAESSSTVTVVSRYVRVVVNSTLGAARIGAAYVHGYTGAV